MCTCEYGHAYTTLSDIFDVMAGAEYARGLELCYSWAGEAWHTPVTGCYMGCLCTQKIR
jgi:hypothetical protein